MTYSLEQHRKDYSKVIADARKDGTVEFLSWFDTSDSLEQSLKRGFWDFSIHMLTPTVCALIDNPEKKTALEIGYGGGRILNAASCFFHHAVGIDIHDEMEHVRTMLAHEGRHNFTLHKTDGTRFNGVESDAIDFVYSFIVLQHVPDFAVFESYMRETYRVLKPGGVAQLYYGSWNKLGPKRMIKNILKPYVEIDAPPSATTAFSSLVLKERTVKKLAEEIGFAVRDTGRSYRGVPNGFPNVKSTQRYITLKKC